MGLHTVLRPNSARLMDGAPTGRVLPPQPSILTNTDLNIPAMVCDLQQLNEQSISHLNTIHDSFEAAFPTLSHLETRQIIMRGDQTADSIVTRLNANPHTALGRSLLNFV